MSYTTLGLGQRSIYPQGPPGPPWVRYFGDLRAQTAGGPKFGHIIKRPG